MHAFTRSKRATWAALAGVLFVVTNVSTAWAKPAPGYRNSGFRLFARVASAIGGNRVSCGILAIGNVCTDSTGSSTGGGGFWPRGTLNQYVFNSGLQLAGIIDSAAPLPWAGQTEGAFFFNARGGGNGTSLTNIWRSSDPDDAANWPDAARVPQGDVTGDLFAPSLQGAVKASDQDVWFLSWEGDPNRLSGRAHTLGVMTETRGLAFSTSGKEDFIFFIYTLYNITCDGVVNPACYATARPTIRDTLNAVSHRFQLTNNAKFGVTMPVGGYRIQSLFAAFGADNDVTVEAAGKNYDGVNVPFSIGYTYHEAFTAEPSWTFDPTIYRAPFFAGAGFIGVKYLKSPVVNGTEVGLSLFGATTNGGQFSDPADTKALFRYLSGTNSSALGDDVCNVGDVKITHICYINQGTSNDMRFFQSSGPLTLGPGEFSSIVVAYIFAPPVAVGGCSVADCQTSIPPQQPTGGLTRFLSPDSVVLGVNTVDSMTGYDGFLGDINGDGKIQQTELKVIPGSLLGKAITAQAVFDSKFAQPAAPEAPQFYLVPGDKSVTVLWSQSASEANGDPYFATAQEPTTYDPNYRQKDVVGYRIYRGNRNDPSVFRLLKQYNYTSGPAVTFNDFTGQINGGAETGCAPELGVFSSCDDAGTVNGVATILPLAHNIAAEGLVQATSVKLLSGDASAFVSTADTAFTGKADAAACGTATPCPALAALGGIPFIYVDNTVANNRAYFYSVVAFDANSIRSGPSSLESARLTKVVVPAPAPTGTQTSGTQSVAQITRGGQPLPTIATPTFDAVTAEFSGPQQPFNAGSAGFAGSFATNLFQGTNTADITLADIDLGDARNGVAVTYTFLAVGASGDSVRVSAPVLQPLDGTDATGTSAPAAVVPVNPAQAVKLGVSPTAHTAIQATTTLPFYQVTNSQGRGCFGDGTIVPTADFPNCDFFGPRWFSGANESTPKPNAGNGTSGSNAGAVPGVARIQWVSAFANYQNGLRVTDATLGGAIRAADMTVYWGAAGHVDSVIDVTHNVPVPFQAKAGGGWFILNQDSTNIAGSFDQRPGVVSFADIGCVEPWYSGPVASATTCAAARSYPPDSVARPGPVAISSGAAETAIRTVAVAANPGFVMYIAGHEFTFEMAPGSGAPSNTSWTLRSYVGSIFNSDPDAGGVYNSTFVEYPVRPWTAIGTGFRLTYSADNKVVPLSGKEGSVADVHTVPDPYYVTTGLETTTDAKVIKFVNLPPQATIRIYTSAGILVRVLQHDNGASGVENWDVRNRNNQFVASGVYFYAVEDAHVGTRRLGRMTIINFTR